MTGPRPLGIRHLTLGRPSLAGELTEADHEMMEERNWEDFLDWQHRRCNGQGYLGEFNAESTLGWLSWLKKYALRLRGALRASRNAQRLRDLEKENGRLAVELKSHTDITSLETLKGLREENAGLRRKLAECHRMMRKWEIQAPTKSAR